MSWTTHYEDREIRLMVSDVIPDVRLFINRMPLLPNAPYDEVYNGSRRLLELWGRAAEALTGQKAKLLEVCEAIAGDYRFAYDRNNAHVPLDCIVSRSIIERVQALIAKATPGKETPSP